MIEIDKNQVIRQLEYVADYDLQKVAWFPNGANLMSSFIEEYCGLFDDTGLSDTMKINQPVFGEIIDQALIDLRDEMDKIDYYKTPTEVIIDSPTMQNVRQKAAHVLTLLQQTGA